MLRLITDEHIHGKIVQGLRAREPTLDVVRVQDVGLSGAEDPTILEWAAREGRVLVTQDVSTIPDFARQRLDAGLPMSGIFLLRRKLTIGQAIDELLMLALCSEPAEWE